MRLSAYTYNSTNRKRVTAELAEERNRFVVELSSSILMGTFGIAVVDDKIYCIGGNVSGVGVVGVNEVYDPATGKWTSRAPMPTARSFLASGVANGKIYAIGGTKNGLQEVATNEEYTPPTLPPTETPTASHTPPATATPTPTPTFDANRPNVDDSGFVDADDLIILLTDWHKRRF